MYTELLAQDSPFHLYKYMSTYIGGSTECRAQKMSVHALHPYVEFLEEEEKT